MKRKPTYTTQIGTITTAGAETTEELIGDLSYKLKRLLRTCRVSRQTRKAHTKLVNVCNAIKWEAIPEDDDVMGLTDELVDALSHYAPPYTWFGEREGEYGFWPLDIDEEDAAGNLVKIRDHHEPDELRSVWGMDVALVNDHGNVECGRYDLRGRFHSYWSAV